MKNCQRCFHLCERTLVVHACFNVKKERIELRISSGNWLIPSFHLHLTFQTPNTHNKKKGQDSTLETVCSNIHAKIIKIYKFTAKKNYKREKFEWKRYNFYQYCLLHLHDLWRHPRSVVLPGRGWVWKEENQKVSESEGLGIMGTNK